MGQATVLGMAKKKVLLSQVPGTGHRETKHHQAKKAEVGLANLTASTVESHFSEFFQPFL